MGITYLKLNLPDQLQKTIKFPEQLKRLEIDPLPIDPEHLRKLIVNNKSALSTILECDEEEIGIVKADPRPILNVNPDIVAEVGPQLHVLEVMVERPLGLRKAVEFERNLGTEKLKNESLKKALARVGLGSIKPKLTVITLASPFFTLAQQSAAIRMGYRLKCLVLARDPKTDELYLLIGNPMDPYPEEEDKESIQKRIRFMKLIKEEVKNFLSATEWIVKDIEKGKLEIYLPLPLRYEPVRIIIRHVISTPKEPRPALVVELKIKNGTKVINAKQITFPDTWARPKPVSTEWGKIWWTYVPMEANEEYTITKLLYPIREIHDAVEAARVD